ncbi:hypothetical protein [Deinococcus aquiradiocola]|uniref:Uncharacterized protein n=1 Tax=Deinococcus aquiradiocola TaxID=393059 RepID=A0A917PS98_9DEIO|nr:hypothetical protein [Deinococcus aquiradiocola]GGJ89283.1 hypothetical protein GCM10008939_36670 [Deinococcus aquiradiocola]
MPSFLPPLLAAAVLAGLSFVVSYPVTVGTVRVDALGLFLMAFALLNLRFAFRQAGRGARAPWWFWPAALLVAALVTFRTVAALHG